MRSTTDVVLATRFDPFRDPYLADPYLFPAYTRAASPACSLLANGTAWDEICCNPPPGPDAIERVLFFRTTQVSSDLKGKTLRRCYRKPRELM